MPNMIFREKNKHIDISRSDKTVTADCYTNECLSTV